MRPEGEQVVVPAERRLRCAEPPVVVGHVAGVLRHPRHREDVAVVGGVGADEMPPHQYGNHQSVERSQRPPPVRQQPAMTHSVGGVEHMESDQREECGDHAEHHHGHLERRRRDRVAGVDGRGEPQAGRRRAGEIGEDADDLRAEVVPAAFTAQRFTAGRRRGVRRGLRFGLAREADEFRGHLVGPCAHGQLPAPRAEHGADRGHHHGGVTHDDDEIAVDPLDEQSAVDGLGCLLGHRGQQHGARPAQPGRRLAGHGDAQIRWYVADQRRRDTVQHAVLRPVQLGGGLLDRKERGQHSADHPEQAGDCGDQAGRAGVVAVVDAFPRRHARFRMARTKGPIVWTVKCGAAKSPASSSTV